MRGIRNIENWTVFLGKMPLDLKPRLVTDNNAKYMLECRQGDSITPVRHRVSVYTCKGPWPDFPPSLLVKLLEEKRIRLVVQALSLKLQPISASIFFSNSKPFVALCWRKFCHRIL